MKVSHLSVFTGFALLTAATTYAMANIKGNGGDVVACRDQTGALTSVELLDFYEARTLRGIQRDLGPAELKVEEKIDLALKRLARLSPQRAATYRASALGFLKCKPMAGAESMCLTGQTLSDVPDSNHVAVPNGCTIEQIVIQRDPEFAEDARYLVNMDLWNLLDNDNKAGLALHEAIYREIRTLGFAGSTAARYFNSYITSHGLDQFQPEQAPIFEFLKKLGLDSFEYGGLIVRLQSPSEFSPDGVLATTLSSENGPMISLPIGKLNLIYGCNSSVLYCNQNQTEFYANKKIKRIYTMHTSTKISGEFKINGVDIKVACGNNLPGISFHENGMLKEGILSAPARRIKSSDGKILDCSIGAYLRFDEQGDLEYYNLEDPQDRSRPSCREIN